VPVYTTQIFPVNNEQENRQTIVLIVSYSSIEVYFIGIYECTLLLLCVRHRILPYGIICISCMDT
jgi:hypothetical protein